MVLGAGFSPDNLPDVDFPTFSARRSSLSQQLFLPRDPGREQVPKPGRSGVPQGPLIVIRKVFGRGLGPSRAAADKLPITKRTACEGSPALYLEISKGHSSDSASFDFVLAAVLQLRLFYHIPINRLCLLCGPINSPCRASELVQAFLPCVLRDLEV